MKRSNIKEENSMSKTGPEIRDEIAQRNEIIDTCMRVNQFVLNSAVYSVMREIMELQKECPHEFQNGKCIFCNQEEEAE